MDTSIQLFHVYFPSSSFISRKTPAKACAFFPGKRTNPLIQPLKVSFPPSSSAHFLSIKNKPQQRKVICMSDDREAKRVKDELKTLQKKVHKEMRKRNVDVAVKLIKDKMAGFGVTLTDAEAKRMAGLSSGTFVVEAYNRYVEAKEKATPKTPPKLLVGKSKKSDKKQKIPPVTTKKKETAAVGGWWGRRRWMNIGGGGWWSRRSWMNAGGGGRGERGGVKKLTPVSVKKNVVSVNKKAGSGGDAGEGGEDVRVEKEVRPATETPSEDKPLKEAEKNVVSLKTAGSGGDAGEGVEKEVRPAMETPPEEAEENVVSVNKKAGSGGDAGEGGEGKA